MSTKVIPVVSQEPVLFDRTLRDNIVYGLEISESKHVTRAECLDRATAFRLDIDEDVEGCQQA